MHDHEGERSAGPRTDAPRSWSALLGHCAEELDRQGIDLPEPLDLAELVARLEQLRGRRIHLTPIRGPVSSETTVCGFTIPTPAGVDAVYYIESHSPSHRIHNILHELAHLIFGHRHSSAAGDPREQEAEAMAAVLRGRWRAPAPARWVATSTLRVRAERITAAVAGPRAWISAVLLIAAITAGLSSEALATSVAPGWAAAAIRLLPFLLVGAAASTLFALARHGSDSSPLAGIPPGPVGMALALIQLVLAGQADAAAGSADFLGATSARIEVDALWLITTAWSAAAAGLLLHVAWPHLRLLPDRGVRVSLRVLAVAVLIASGGGACVATGLLAVHHTRAAWTDTVIAVGGTLVALGAALGAVALVIPRLLVSVAPFIHARRSMRALRQLEWLLGTLRVAAPEWDSDRPAPRWRELRSRARLDTRLYQQVITIQDMSWTLLAAVDSPMIDRAARFADRWCARHGEDRVAAAAEACWLAHAVAHRDQVPSPSHEIVILEQGSEIGDEQPGEAELEFLLDVARIWRQGDVVGEFLAELRTAQPRPHVGGAPVTDPVEDPVCSRPSRPG